MHHITWQESNHSSKRFIFYGWTQHTGNNDLKWDTYYSSNFWYNYFWSSFFQYISKTLIKKVLDLAINVSKIYQPPNRNFTSKDLLGVIRYQNMEKKLSLIKKGWDIFGFLFIGNGITISIIPLLKILVSGKIF